MYNSTTNIMPYQGGVILPHSEKVLGVKEIDKKISKLKGHIDYLSAQLSQRNTHGGKGFRARQISLKSQIAQSQGRLHLLEKAQLKALEVEVPLLENFLSYILENPEQFTNFSKQGNGIITFVYTPPKKNTP